MECKHKPYSIPFGNTYKILCEKCDKNLTLKIKMDENKKREKFNTKERKRCNIANECDIACYTCPYSPSVVERWRGY